MTRAQLRTMVRRELPEVVADVVADSTIDVLLNEGYDDFCRNSLSAIREVSFSIQGNQSNPELLQMPAYVVKPFILTLQNSNRVLLSATEKDLLSIYGNWYNQVGQPTYILQLAPNLYRLVPKPETTFSDTARALAAVRPVTGSPIPGGQPMQTDSDEPSLLAPDFHPALVYYAVSKVILQLPNHQVHTPLLAIYQSRYHQDITRAHFYVVNTVDRRSLPTVVLTVPGQGGQGQGSGAE